MSLSERLGNAKPRRTKRGCETCIWLADLSQQDQQSILDWVTNGWSIRQLYNICTNDPERPLLISETAFKNHLRDCLGLIK